MATISIGITIEKDTLAEIESKRGLIPRSTYIQSILEKSLKNGGKN